MISLLLLFLELMSLRHRERSAWRLVRGISLSAADVVLVVDSVDFRCNAISIDSLRRLRIKSLLALDMIGSGRLLFDVDLIKLLFVIKISTVLL